MTRLRGSWVVGFGLCVVIGAGGGCANSTPYEPFKVPREEVREEVRVVALAPIRVTRRILDASRARRRFEIPIVKRLSEAGVRALDSTVWDSLWLRFGTDVGEIFDPSTGEADPERYRIVRDAVHRELETNLDVDAILYVSITTVELHAVASSSAQFCGGKQPVYWPHGWAGTFFLSDPATLVVGTCLEASIYDLDGRELYGIRSSLEVFETYARQTRALRPEALRFRDDVQIAEAINDVIGPLVDNLNASN